MTTKAAIRESWILRYLTPPTRPTRTSWIDQATCRGTPADAVTVTTCETCPVRLDCLHDAYTVESELPACYIFHVRGGLTATTRVKALRRQRHTTPDDGLHPLVVAVMAADDERLAVAS